MWLSRWSLQQLLGWTKSLDCLQSEFYTCSTSLSGPDSTLLQPNEQYIHNNHYLLANTKYYHRYYRHGYMSIVYLWYSSAMSQSWMNLEGALGLMTFKLQDMLGKELVVGCRLPGVVLKVEGPLMADRLVSGTETTSVRTEYFLRSSFFLCTPSLNFLHLIP